MPEFDFAAHTPFNVERPHSLVVCCSDGRWLQQVQEFMAGRVGGLVDLYAVAGGPAGFDWYSSSLEDSRVAEFQVKFFAEHHEINKVWLIAHEECAWYRVKYRSEDDLTRRRRQYKDLLHAQKLIQGWHRHLEVINVFASRVGATVVFEILTEAELRHH